MPRDGIVHQSNIINDYDDYDYKYNLVWILSNINLYMILNPVVIYSGIFFFNDAQLRIQKVHTQI